MTRVRSALIGCGKVGHIHAAALKALPEADFIAVCDTSADRAAVFATQYGARPFSDVAAMLGETRPEAVLIHATSRLSRDSSGLLQWCLAGHDVRLITDLRVGKDWMRPSEGRQQ